MWSIFLWSIFLDRPLPSSYIFNLKQVLIIFSLVMNEIGQFYKENLLKCDKLWERSRPFAADKNPSPWMSLDRSEVLPEDSDPGPRKDFLEIFA